MATIAETLAARVAGTRFDQVTPGALTGARIGLTDTVAVGIAGSRDDAARIARRVIDSTHGRTVVWGTADRASAGEAAFANGIAANVLDYDDCTDHLGGHPSSPVLPALLALAAERRATGRELVTAYVAGFEIETRLGRGVNTHHYDKGWHPTATLGVFGAAAACARLLALDAVRTMHALALCTSLAAGVKSNLGSMGKPMHVGQAAKNGLLAARLAAEGFTANADAFEHPHGFLRVFNGEGHYSVEHMLAGWGDPWEIEMPGIAIKQYPCCLSTQSAVDLALDLTRTHDLRAGQVVRIDARVAGRRLAHTDRPAPRSALDAKLSVQYVLACAIADRAVGLRHFEGETYRAPHLRETMARVEARAMADADLAVLGDSGATLAITLADGRTVAGRIGRPVGHEPGVPLTAPALAAKFHACVDPVLGPERAGAIEHALAEIEASRDVRAFTELLAGDPTSTPA